jgi:Subtilase family/Secretion system C-terminal sorting domain
MHTLANRNLLRNGLIHVIVEKILVASLCFFAATVFGQGKLSPRLTDKGFKFETGTTPLSVSVKDSIAFRQKYKGTIAIHHQQGRSNCFVITAFYGNVFEAMKRDSNILFIDHHRKAVAEASLDYVNPSFNRITKAHQFFPDLNGAAHTISVKEQGFDPLNIDLLNRSFTTSVSPSATSQHATAMAILIAGAGNSSFHAKGVASQAHFTSSDFNNLFPDVAAIFSANNIHVQNHSYGIEIENYYGNEAFAYDQQVYQNPTLVHVFSAGNSGKSKPSSGTYQNIGYANLTGNFKQAKNVLVVNAVDSALTINALNSRGPAFDGRVKPELTAYGQGGTSEAAALVSGISTLIQEKYQLITNELPEVSMVKAILIASADDIGSKGIDYLYGYGSVNVYKALRLVELGQLFTSTLTSNTQLSFPINIPTSVSEIKIAIAWTDPPAAPNASSGLINDIDSWLDDGTSVINPWVLNAYPHSDSLMAAPKRKTDHLNNVEYITLNNPPLGTYQLILKSGNLNSASQKVSVAYWMTGDKTFSWDFPGTTDIVEGGKKNLLVWEAQPTKTGDLYMQLDQGNWQLIESGIDIDHYFYWTCPDTLAKARLKMKIGLEEFISDDFLLSPLPQMKTAFICADSIGVTWKAIKKATNYELYTLDTQYLKKIAVTSDTLVVLPTAANTYFAVAPVMNGLSGLKSETINYTQQGAFCFINLFNAERFDGTQVRVQLSLSSLHQIDHITIFKTINGIKNIFKELSPGKLVLDFYDTELLQGTMAYQAEITFKNGTKIRSDIIELIIEGKGKALLYPNPVTASSDLNILSGGAGQKFKILDLLGKILFEKELELVVEPIDLIDLPSGLYLYQVQSQGKVTDAGRFIKY